MAEASHFDEHNYYDNSGKSPEDHHRSESSPPKDDKLGYTTIFLLVVNRTIGTMKHFIPTKSQFSNISLHRIWNICHTHLRPQRHWIRGCFPLLMARRRHYWALRCTRMAGNWTFYSPFPNPWGRKEDQRSSKWRREELCKLSLVLLYRNIHSTSKRPHENRRSEPPQSRVSRPPNANMQIFTARILL